MKKYSPRVSIGELKKAEKPTKIDLAIAAKAFGIALQAGVIIPQCFKAVIEITPNARLREALARASQDVHQGEEVASAFQRSRGTLNELFIAAFFYEEHLKWSGEVLLTYAREFGIRPHQLAKHIGRRDDVMQLTYTFAQTLRHIPIPQILRNVQAHNTSDLRSVLGRILRDYEAGFLLYEALEKHPKYFDQLYIEILKAGQNNGAIEKVFGTLAEA